MYVSEALLLAYAEPLDVLPLNASGASTIVPVDAETLALQKVPSLIPLVGTTSNAVADVGDLQHRSFVLVTSVSGAVDGAKFAV